MKKIAGLILALSFTQIFAQDLNIIPQPSKVQMGTGAFSFSPDTKLVAADSEKELLNLFNTFLHDFYGYQLPVSSNMKEKGIRLIRSTLPAPLDKGGYKMRIATDGIEILGSQEGLFRGITTLLQLFPAEKKTNFKLNSCEIEDFPRFGYRGMHLDAGRHFFPVSFIKKYIDYLALHKFNVFHWHLTEDQGWRIEIKKYPALTQTGAWRNGTIIGRYPGKGNDNIRYGGFYTQAEIRELVTYAAKRFIDVIPEIEMPGHSSAAIAAYPWLSCFPDKPTHIPANMISQKSVEEQKNGRIKLVQETWGIFDDVFCAGNDSTFLFLQDVIDEVVSLFPSRYFHIGGDECPKTHWKICPKCQKRMKENGLKDEHELQSWFVQRIEKYLNNKGRILIGWDEILEGGLAPNAVVMSWRGEKGGIEAARQSHQVIMTPGNPVYFDHTQSENEDSVTIGGFNPIEKVYAYEPVPKELTAAEGAYVLGAQANVWTEYMKNIPKVEYMIFPRMAALSEVLWSPKEKRDWHGFEQRLPMQLKRYQHWGANYSNAYYELKSTVLPTADHKGIIWSVASKISNDSIFFSKPEDIVSYRAEGNQLLILGNGTMEATLYINGSVKSKLQQQFFFNKATGKKITLKQEPSRNYPGNGAFTLVNGVQNEKGLARSREFLGFNGTDCEAVIDLGNEELVTKIITHVFEQKSSWIWNPRDIDVMVSMDGENFAPVSGLKKELTGNRPGLTFTEPVKARYIRLVIYNKGEIPEGAPGAGNKAWLFVDEIEVH